jgi:hypothetical protein
MGGAPARKRSPWVKAGIGCGSALVLVVVAVACSFAWAFHRGASLMDRMWAEAGTDVALLRTDEGARRLFRTHPHLGVSYPAEDSFMAAARQWRTRLGDLPPRPGLLEVMHRHGPVVAHLAVGPGSEVLSLQVRLVNGSRLYLEEENGELADIHVDRGG